MTQADYEEVSKKALSLFQYGQVSSLFLLWSVSIVKYSGNLETKSLVMKFSLRLHRTVNKERVTMRMNQLE